MKFEVYRKNPCTGFTLLEIILTILVSSILGSILYSYFNSMLQGNDSHAKLRRMYDLQTVMEKIAAHYDEITGKSTVSQWEAAKAYAVGDKAVSRSEPYGHIYVCTDAGSSGSTEPVWPANPGATVTDGTVTWQEDGGELDALVSKFSTPENGTPPSPDAVWDYGYGRYGIVNYGFIRFEGGIETRAPEGSAQNLLKISIKNEDGYSITALFSTTY
ncbi:MAG: prepilin-type N-terminal cleavage/methylation domain-containing protein [Desulfobacterales bacterium]